MKSIKKWALVEPLVDYVDRKNINSEATPILNIDLKTVKASDLDFSNNYKVKIIRNDYVHALVAWFDCYFSHCHIPVKLSTSKKQFENYYY